MGILFLFTLEKKSYMQANKENMISFRDKIVMLDKSGDGTHITKFNDEHSCEISCFRQTYLHQYVDDVTTNRGDVMRGW